MLKNRAETWLAIVVLGLGLIPLGILGLWSYMSTTVTILHPDAADAPSMERPGSLTKWDDAIRQSQEIVRTALSEQNLPGVSAAVGVDDEIVWAEGFGWADLDRKVPVAPDMTFRIGTASIVLTSAAAGLLLEEGRLKLDEPIQTYVPEYPPQRWPVTVRHVMGHLAGIANDGGDEGPLFTRHCDRPADAVQFLSGREREARFEPGTAYRFSSYGWILVSAAIESAAGMPFLTFMTERVFAPLGMADTRADSAIDPPGTRVTPYFPRFAADPKFGLHLMRPLDYSCYAGASVFLSTPSDLVRFGMKINDGALLKPATVQLLQESQRLSSGEETGYGLGWDRETVQLGDRPARWVGHDGLSLGGSVASLMTFPERRLTVAVLSNISYADAEALALKIVQAFAAGHPGRRLSGAW